MTFEDLVFAPHPNFPEGRQARVKFPNGYGASVICIPPYVDPWELAVLYHGDLCYTSGLTTDVLPRLTEAEVSEYLTLIEALPAKDAA